MSTTTTTSPTPPTAPTATPPPALRTPPACGSGQRPGHYNTALHLVALVIILGLSTLACSFPILVRRLPTLPVPHRFLFLSRHFGTGVLIATAFVHLLPTAFVSLTEPCLPRFWNKSYPAMAGLIAMCAVFVVVGIEMFFASRGAGHIHASVDPRAHGLLGARPGPEPGPGGDGDGSGVGEGASGGGRRVRRVQRNGHVESFPAKANGWVAGDGAKRHGAWMDGDDAAPWAHEMPLLQVNERDRPRMPPSTSNEVVDDADDDDDGRAFGSGEVSPGAETPFLAGAGDGHGMPSRSTTTTTTTPLSPRIPDAGYSPRDPDAAPEEMSRQRREQQQLEEKKLLLQCLLLEAGILFHSVFIGMALSVATGTSFVVLLVAISFHQTFEGLALGSRIAAIPSLAPTSIKPWLMALAYGTTTPLGQAIGLLVHNLYDPASQTGLLMVGIMNAISSGLLLFAGLVELLAEDFLSDKSYEVLQGRKRLEASLAVMAGGMLMALVGAWA
ncbi:MAG: hypothetical protein M1826_001962 [Phylliscum demangeonii]|nr:MAG: hypothetical protein M1826_001962 [Phylliscum demangeonii]